MTNHWLTILTLGLLLAAAVGLWLWTRRPVKPTEGFGLPTETIKVDDFEIRFHRSGRGPYLILMHGIGADLQCWRFLVPLLQKMFTVVALDLPGFGQSSKIPDVSYGLDDQAKRICRFFDRLGIKEAFIVGNSMGGNLALWLAIAHRHRVKGVAVIAPPSRVLPASLKKLSWVARPASYLVARPTVHWIHRLTVSKRELVTRERVEETFKVYGGNPDAVASFLMATETLSDVRLMKRLREVDQPVLILWGSRDRLVSRRMIRKLERALPHYKSVSHIGGGHHLQEDEPQWTADKISEFFTT